MGSSLVASGVLAILGSSVHSRKVVASGQGSRGVVLHRSPAYPFLAIPVIQDSDANLAA